MSVLRVNPILCRRSERRCGMGVDQQSIRNTTVLYNLCCVDLEFLCAGHTKPMVAGTLVKATYPDNPKSVLDPVHCNKRKLRLPTHERIVLSVGAWSGVRGAG